MKTVDEVRKIVAAVRERGDEDEPTEDELPCDDCPADAFCSRDDFDGTCVETLEAYIKQQEAAK